MNKFNIPDLSYLAKQKEMMEKKNKADKDVEYSEKYWKSFGDDLVLREKMENVMRGDILSNVEKGQIVFTAGLDESGSIDEKTKQKASALRQLAQDMGYGIGGFILTRHQTLIAKLSEKSKK